MGGLTTGSLDFLNSYTCKFEAGSELGTLLSSVLFGRGFKHGPFCLRGACVCLHTYIYAHIYIYVCVCTHTSGVLSLCLFGMYKNSELGVQVSMIRTVEFLGSYAGPHPTAPVSNVFCRQSYLGVRGSYNQALPVPMNHSLAP